MPTIEPSPRPSTRSLPTAAARYCELLNRGGTPYCDTPSRTCPSLDAVAACVYVSPVQRVDTSHITSHISHLTSHISHITSHHLVISSSPGASGRSRATVASSSTRALRAASSYFTARTCGAMCSRIASCARYIAPLKFLTPGVYFNPPRLI